MERLAEQIVDWHNRHPLARRIAVGEVNAVGVVALPFVRASAEAGGLVEPVLTEAVGFDELAAAPPPSPLALLGQRLRGAVRLPGRRPQTQWRTFSEKFLPGVGLARVERFALAHGFAEPPAEPEAQPWRVIVIDERLAATHSGWPFELYLATAGIEAGGRRTRVLAGRGIPSEILGRRLWDPLRLGAAAAVLALLAAAGAWLLWPGPAAEPVPAPAAAASAASAPVAPPSAPASQAEAASAPEPASSEAEPQPDIRPHLVERSDGKPRPPLLSSEPAAEAPAEKAVEKAPEPPPAASAPAPADPRLPGMAQSPQQLVVALVGPPGSKAEAEALLKKMQAGLVGVHSNPAMLQGDVIQTPEGWRATVWPFASREQAQLINATLVARGYKTRAVNF